MGLYDTVREMPHDERLQILGHTKFTVEDLLEAEGEFAEFCLDLEAEWPPDRIKSFLLDEYRDRCKRCLEKEKELEVENRDQRAQGASYKDRKIYSTRIIAIRQLFNEYRSIGLRLKKMTFTARQFVTPSQMALIQSRGFETTLRLAII